MASITLNENLEPVTESGGQPVQIQVGIVADMETKQATITTQTSVRDLDAPLADIKQAVEAAEQWVSDMLSSYNLSQPSLQTVVTEVEEQEG